MELKHLYYSETASKYGTAIYRLEDGTQVEVTLAAIEPDTCKWPDAQYLGKGTFVRGGRPDTSGTVRFEERINEPFARAGRIPGVRLPLPPGGGGIES